MLRVGKIIFFFAFLSLPGITGWSQNCTTIGQMPSTAFPVCGTTKFTQLKVPICSNGNVPYIGCSSSTIQTANPYWYKFTCYTSGTLGFVITPLSTDRQDYDWQLFDITGRDPNDVFSIRALTIAANWAGTYGLTGASAAGTTDFECGSDPAQNKPTFSRMPALIAGHEYLLLVSHFLNAGETSEAGYTLSFEGGTAVITNPVTPSVKNTHGVCDGTEIVVKLSKTMLCSSVAADGSDFRVSGGPIPISVVSATPTNCSGFDMETVTLKLNRPLILGTYTVTSQVGTDGNSLVDLCENTLAAGIQSQLRFIPKRPTPMDSIMPVVCIQDTLRLVFSKPMLCSSIAPDGSDFDITGPAPVTVKSAQGICNNGTTLQITLILSRQIRVNGTFTITLKNGTDGNSLIDECGEITPVGSTLPFTTKNITAAAFQSPVATGCKSDTLFLSHDGNGNANKWQWTIDSVPYSTAQATSWISKAFGNHIARLTVTNGICSDTAGKIIVLPDNTVKAAFAVADTLCPTDALQFTDQSSANATSWRWTFANGNTSTSKTPDPQVYPLNGRISQYTTSLTVGNNLNCTDVAFKIVTVLASCYMAVPSAFTPNGDGINDYFYPLNAFKTDNLVFRVYNRFGQIIFETKDWTKKWDGRFKGLPQPSGTYIWTLDYNDTTTGQKVNLKGTTVLIR